MTPPTIDGNLAALVASLLAAVGTVAVAVLGYIASRRKEPIERESATAAASAGIADAAVALVAPYVAQVERLELRVQRAEERAESAERKAESAERKASEVGRLASEADDYIRDLHQWWETHRLKPRPPFWRWIEEGDH